MHTNQTEPISEQEIQKITDKYLSAKLAQGEEEFNRQLKKQFDDVITAITDLLPQDKYFDPNEIRQLVQKHVKANWLKYKKREGSKPDSITKRLAADFKDYFVSLILGDNAQKNIRKALKPLIKKSLF